MKKLFVCETPIQLIVALCLNKQNEHKNDNSDIIFTNTFSNYKNTADKVKKLNLFENVYTVEIRFSGIKNKKTSLQCIFNIKKVLHKNLIKNLPKYDELYFCNYDTFNYSLRKYLSQKNKRLKTYYFEEGYSSYFPYDEVEQSSFLMKLVNLKNSIIHKKMLRDNGEGLYLFEPTLAIFQSKLPLLKIDRNILNTDEYKKLILKIFDSEKVAKKYDKKYIILEEFHPEYKDEEIFDEIIKKVSKENVIVKLHPRRKENRFEKKGIQTFGNDGVPWESLLFFGNFSDKILISIGSSSISTQRILFGDNMNAYLLFKFCGSNLKQFSNQYKDFWDKLESKDKNRGIHIPNTYDEFIRMIDNEKEK